VALLYAILTLYHFSLGQGEMSTFIAQVIWLISLKSCVFIVLTGNDSVNRTPAVESPRVVTKIAFYRVQN